MDLEEWNMDRKGRYSKRGLKEIYDAFVETEGWCGVDGNGRMMKGWMG